MDKICVKCGNKLKKGVKFCTFCGQKVEEIKEEPKPKVENIEKAPPVQEFPEPEQQEKQTPEPEQQEKQTPEPMPQLQDIPVIIPPETKPPKQSKPVDKIILPAIIIALILSVAAIILPFIAGDDTLSSGSVDTEALASNSVTSAKIVDGAVTDDDIVDTGISKIANSAITSDDIAENVIGFLHLNSELNDAITRINEIADGEITSEKIKDLTIVTNDLANSSVTSAKIVDGTISSSDIATDAVGPDEISENAVGASEIASNAVGYSEMGIKIKYGLASNIINGSSVSHGIGSQPISVILTPRYNLTFGRPLQANVYDVTASDFQIAIWQETAFGNLVAITASEPQSVYWIAIYS